jgi:hypothetical protein
MGFLTSILIAAQKDELPLAESSDDFPSTHGLRTASKKKGGLTPPFP